MTSYEIKWSAFQVAYSTYEKIVLLYMRIWLFIIGCFMGILGCRNDNPNVMLNGVWKLHIIETQDSTGKWIESGWMKNGVSYIHYDGNQNMSVHFTPEGFAQTNSSDQELDSLPLEELKMLASDYWYLGKYTVHADSGIVEHKRIIHSDPNEWGKTVQRHFQFKSDTLMLSANEFGLRLKWVPATMPD